MARVIEDSLARNDRRLDLGVGAEAYKRRLRTHVESCSSVTHTRRDAWRPRLLRIARRWRRPAA